MRRSTPQGPSGTPSACSRWVTRSSPGRRRPDLGWRTRRHRRRSAFRGGGAHRCCRCWWSLAPRRGCPLWCDAVDDHLPSGGRGLPVADRSRRPSGSRQLHMSAAAARCRQGAQRYPDGRVAGMIELWRYSAAVSCCARPTRSAVAVSTGTSSDSRSIANSAGLRTLGWSSSSARDYSRCPVHRTRSREGRFGSGCRSVTSGPSTNVWWRRE